MIYSETIPSKTGETIPLFIDKKPMHSKYNPHAECLAENVEEGFYVIGGIGGSFHIKSLLEKLGKDSFVLAVEDDRESLDFALESGISQAVRQDNRVQFCTINELEFQLKNLYLPVLYSSFFYLSQRAWETHAENAALRIKAIIQETLSSISADYSVQAHFGKQWQKNIMQNLMQIKPCKPPFVPSDKIAGIIAAGPSLDKSIQELKQNFEKTVIFCTDTAYQTLQKHSIEPDYLVSIDCQNLSLEHFRNYSTHSKDKKACVILDLGSSPEIARFMNKQGHDVYFISSFHPLSKMASGKFNIPVINSGSGTVAMAACDIARLCGARKIKLYGADFAYSGGKPYAKGTYLDSIYGRTSGRTSTSETLFSALMYRTELKPCKPIFSSDLENPLTSSVLESYSKALSAWAKGNSYEYENGFLSLSYTGKLSLPEQKTIDERQFIADYLDHIGKICEKSTFELKKDEYFYGVLPFVAWQKNMLKDDNISIFEHLKLAYYAIKRYTIFYEK